MSSSHRIYLDGFLQRGAVRLRGDVLDAGGRRGNRKGDFRIPDQGIASWRYLNIDADAQPDILCNAENIPLPAESVDGFMLSEVLEHRDMVLRLDRKLPDAWSHITSGWGSVVRKPLETEPAE